MKIKHGVGIRSTEGDADDREGLVKVPGVEPDTTGLGGSPDGCLISAGVAGDADPALGQEFALAGAGQVNFDKIHAGFTALLLFALCSTVLRQGTTLSFAAPARSNQ